MGKAKNRPRRTFCPPFFVLRNDILTTAADQWGPPGVATGTPPHSNGHAVAMQRGPRCNPVRALRRDPKSAVIFFEKAKLLIVNNLRKITKNDYFSAKIRPSLCHHNFSAAFCQYNSEFLTYSFPFSILMVHSYAPSDRWSSFSFECFCTFNWHIYSTF